MNRRAGLVVVGLGNDLMSDEGIGLWVVRHLAGYPHRPADVELAEGGTSPMDLVHLIAGRRKAVIVDCARMGSAAGTLRRFGPDDVRSMKTLAGLSLHEGDALGVLALSRRLGECPAEVVLFGVEPELIAPGAQLSDLVQGRLGEYADAIRSEVEWPSV